MKIQIYRPQFVSPVQQRHSTVGYEQEARVGDAIARTGQAVDQVGQQASQFASLLIQQQNATEIAKGRGAYQNWKTQWEQGARENPVNPDGTMRYLNLPAEFEEAAKKFADDQNRQFSFRGGRRGFSDWMQTQMASDIDGVTRMAWQQQVEAGLQQSNTDLEQAVNRGDREEIGRILSENVVTGLRSDAQALDISEQLSRGIAVREVLENTRRVAAEAGTQRAGFEYMAEAMAQPFADILTGETREFTLGDREKMDQDFRQKYDQEIKMQREERLNVFYPTFEELSQKFYAGQLTMSDLLDDDRTVHTQHDPFNLRDYFMGRLRGDRSGETDFNQGWEELARGLWADPQLPDDRFREGMRDLLSQGMPGEVFQKFYDRRRHPSAQLQTALNGIDRAYDTLMRNAGDNEQKIVSAMSMYNVALQMFYDEFDFASRSQLQPQDWDTHISKLGGNIVAKMLSGDALRRLEGLSIDPQQVSSGNQTWTIMGFEVGRATQAYELQKAIEGGWVIGYRERIQGPLNRLAEGYSRHLNELVGPGGRWSMTPNGQPYASYRVPEDARSMLREFAVDDGQVNLTFMTSETGRNMELRVWNGRTRAWQRIDDQLQGALREAGVWTVTPPPTDPADPVGTRPPNAAGSRAGALEAQPAPKAPNAPMSRNDAMRLQRDMQNFSQ
jgi:hypothetical protein